MKSDDQTKTYSILIADDNPNNLKILGSMLEKMGYNVRVAKNGEQAFNSVKTLPPDLILLDIHMPIMDGYEVCKAIKKEKDIQDIPIIFLSALTESFNKIQAFKAGGVDYITKPFEVEEVEIRIINHIRLRERSLKLQIALDELKVKEKQLIQTEKMAALGVLTSGLAHEINNPINFISNSILALKERTDKLIDMSKTLASTDEDVENLRKTTKDVPEIFDNITTGIDHITNIVKSLRIYSRVDKDQLVLSSISELIDTSLLILYHRYKEKILIEKNYNSAPKTLCHPAKISQVFLNILSNAIDGIDEANLKYGEQIDRKIVITTSFDEKNSTITINFQDNGIGIKESVKNKIFDPFFTTKEVNKGSGLGLAICSSIIKEHNGTISVESAGSDDKSKTSFTVILPVRS
ncbi:MAG TPA: response regulator [Spirochaetota bacterium]|jgi:signal transduction histidine kinase|nr:MAG: Alkaline phosphatase synthesis transcriptional regulatory protein PhoP [Spirochaetes bacterium ADurb.Bin133]HNZ26319.1 response regulator [Spirochaetota bacterium]HPY88409.1 response regulator [Spirochaetota bacterium]HQB61920.1 response regulator [Spirochaetota bacterium]